MWLQDGGLQKPAENPMGVVGGIIGQALCLSATVFGSREHKYPRDLFVTDCIIWQNSFYYLWSSIGLFDNRIMIFGC
ncbi:hypothetical protein L1987_24495 [Smallanthus sonchifolius]|uniref:Uncharacterized protein n=1 Tax=Smallanthus sonchifolius TaxID=185202 RepID=A0ACB9IN94_9ASTR|nr:hypothetical protein L1987_24495 [Smallanthus sonchifolius]